MLGCIFDASFWTLPFLSVVLPKAKPSFSSFAFDSHSEEFGSVVKDHIPHVPRFYYPLGSSGLCSGCGLSFNNFVVNVCDCLSVSVFCHDCENFEFAETRRQSVCRG